MRHSIRFLILALIVLAMTTESHASSMNKTYNVSGSVFLSLGSLFDTVSGTITTSGTVGGAGTFNTNLTSGNHGGVGFDGSFTEQNFAAFNFSISKGTANFEGVVTGGFTAIQIGPSLIVIATGNGSFGDYPIFGFISLTGSEVSVTSATRR